MAFEIEPKPITPITPEYPELARKAGIEGTVWVKILIDKRGNVRDAQIIRGIGAGLDEAAVEALKNTKYTPAIQNNQPVAVWVAQRIIFNLR